jgi:hypothetical protein
MDKLNLERVLDEKLSELGVFVEEPRTIVHWANPTLKKGYVDEDYPDNYYIEAKTKYGDWFFENEKLVAPDDSDVTSLMEIVRHFKVSIKPLVI